MFRGFSNVFSFTVRMQTSSRGWRGLTIGLALFLLLTPILVMTLIESTEPEEPVYSGNLRKILLVDKTEGEADYSGVTSGDKALSAVAMTRCASLDEALEQLDETGIVLYIYNEDGEYRVDLIQPDNPLYTSDDADLLSFSVSDTFPGILLQKSGISMEALMLMSTPIEIKYLSEGPELPTEPETDEMLKEILGMLIPYVTVMFLYFFVLFYGQSTAQLVLSEKTSKLMDTVLVSVSPISMVFGKVLAAVSCAFLQLALWILSLLGGFVLGGEAARAINPNTSVDLIGILRDANISDSLFSPVAMILSLLIMLSGCILYCSMAAIGGAVAGKQEDLQSTNILFTLAIVVSLMAVVFGGNVMETGVMSTAEYLNWIPFTAVLITPARVLLGQISFVGGLAVLMEIILFSGVFLIAAGKLYHSMSFYKGNLPKAKEIISLLTKRN